ncbi:MAG: hypothetical protein K0R08_1319 [Solimicrobium sp.]|jgi:hypothetical protein|nr:hypothetical protein [Solimicrobium sp.]
MGESKGEVRRDALESDGSYLQGRASSSISRTVENPYVFFLHKGLFLDKQPNFL